MFKDRNIEQGEREDPSILFEKLARSIELQQVTMAVLSSHIELLAGIRRREQANQDARNAFVWFNKLALDLETGFEYFMVRSVNLEKGRLNLTKPNDVQPYDKRKIKLVGRQDVTEYLLNANYYPRRTPEARRDLQQGYYAKTEHVLSSGGVGIMVARQRVYKDPDSGQFMFTPQAWVTINIDSDFGIKVKPERISTEGITSARFTDISLRYGRQARYLHSMVCNISPLSKNC